MAQSPTLELRPALVPFVLRRMGRNVGALTILVLVSIPVLAALDLTLPWIILGLVYLGLLGFAMTDAVIRSRRSWWEVGPGRVSGGGGGLFSRHRTELEMDRITQMTLTRPFLEARLFGTGYVTIKAAGSGRSHLVMRSVRDPVGVFTRLQEEMRRAGFSLRRDQMLMEARPAMAECLWYMGRHFLTRALLLVAVLVVAAGALALLMGLGFALESGGEVVSILRGDAGLPEGSPEWLTSAVLGWISLGFSILLVLGLVWAAFPPGLRFAQIRSRRYRLFEDVVEREEGLLSQSLQFIPMENLSDVSISQILRQRLLGTANVELSCQGRGRTIQFPWMAGASRFSETLRGLLRTRDDEELEPETGEAHSGAEPAESSAGTGGSGVTGPGEPVGAVAAPGDGKRTFTPSHEPEVELSISLPRGLFGHFLKALATTLQSLLVLGLSAWALYTFVPDLAQEVQGYEEWIVGAILGFSALPLLGFAVRAPGRVIRMRAVRYRLDDREVEGTFALLSRETRRFALHRVTAVTSTSGILDRLFGTVSMSFHALGAQKAIRFTHVPAGAVEVDSLVRRLGLGQDPGPGDTGAPEAEVLRARVTPRLWVHANLVRVVWTGIWIAVTTPFALLHPLILILPALAILSLVHRFGSEVWDAGSGQLELGTDHLVIRRGRLRRRTFLAGYHHIREVRTRHYPLAKAGSVEVKVAGGRRGGIGYLPEPDALHQRLDAILLSHPPEGQFTSRELEPEERMTARPRARNVLIPLTVVSVVLFPLLVVYPVLFLIALIQQRRIRYNLESHRVVETGGLLVRYARSILYDRIDSVSTSRGFLNGVVGNGVVSVSTAGGAGAQMRLQNIPEDEAVARALRAGAGAA